jgi:hypothetical protein
MNSSLSCDLGLKLEKLCLILKWVRYSFRELPEIESELGLQAEFENDLKMRVAKFCEHNLGVQSRQMVRISH